MELEIRRIVAEVLKLTINEVGVSRGPNLTIVAIRNFSRPLSMEQQLSVVGALHNKFTPMNVDLGLVRFL